MNHKASFYQVDACISSSFDCVSKGLWYEKEYIDFPGGSDDNLPAMQETVFYSDTNERLTLLLFT